MFQRGAGRKIWTSGVLAPLLAVFVLALQSVAVAPCAVAAPAPAAHTDAHCAEAAADPHERHAPAPDTGGCCECLAAVAVPVLAQPPALTIAAGAVSVAALTSRPDAPALRAIASGPPSQAPPARI